MRYRSQPLLHPFLLLELTALVLWASNAQAGLVTYSDYPAWNSAVSGVTSVTIPDPAPDPFVYFGTGSASTSYGGVVFSTDGGISDSSFYNVGTMFSGVSAVLSSQSATTGPENILILFPAPVYGFALNYGTFEGSNVSFLLSNGAAFAQSSTGGNSYDAPDFVGVTDDGDSFSSVLITSNDPGLNIRSLSYVSAVPEPGGLALLASITPLIIFRLVQQPKKRARSFSFLRQCR